MTVHTHQQCFHSSRWKSPSVQIPPKQGAQLQMNKTVPASSFRGSGHTLRTEAGNSRFIEEAPPRAFSRERISTLRRSAYREEEAGVSRKVKAQCIRQHIKLCQPREILTPRMSRESLCDMGEKVAARATLSAPIVIIGEALELRRCHELCAPRQYLGFQNG